MTGRIAKSTTERPGPPPGRSVVAMPFQRLLSSADQASAGTGWAGGAVRLVCEAKTAATDRSVGGTFEPTTAAVVGIVVDARLAARQQIAATVTKSSLAQHRAAMPGIAVLIDARTTLDHGVRQRPWADVVARRAMVRISEEIDADTVAVGLTLRTANTWGAGTAGTDAITTAGGAKITAAGGTQFNTGRTTGGAAVAAGVVDGRAIRHR
jgi:hypothetical protein